MEMKEYRPTCINQRIWRNGCVRVGYSMYSMQLSMTSNEFAANTGLYSYEGLINTFLLTPILFEYWFFLVTFVIILLIIICCIRGIVRLASIFFSNVANIRFQIDLFVFLLIIKSYLQLGSIKYIKKIYVLVLISECNKVLIKFDKLTLYWHQENLDMSILTYFMFWMQWLMWLIIMIAWMLTVQRISSRTVFSVVVRECWRRM